MALSALYILAPFVFINRKLKRNQHTYLPPCLVLKMVKSKRPYRIDDYTRHLRRINKLRKKEGLPPIKRRKRKTNRPYRYSGKYVGANGGKRRIFTNKETQNMMNSSQSPYIDTEGKSICEKKELYQGKYQKWWGKEALNQWILQDEVFKVKHEQCTLDCCKKESHSVSI